MDTVSPAYTGKSKYRYGNLFWIKVKYIYNENSTMAPHSINVYQTRRLPGYVHVILFYYASHSLINVIPTWIAIIRT